MELLSCTITGISTSIVSILPMSLPTWVHLANDSEKKVAVFGCFELQAQSATNDICNQISVYRNNFCKK